MVGNSTKALIAYVDPGVRTGWAMFRGAALVDAGGFGKDGAEVYELCQTFRSTMSGVDIVYIEGVDTRGGRGNMPALLGGSVMLLAQIVGAYRSTVRHAYVVTPLWKGNLDKTAMKAQLYRMRPDLATVHLPAHTIDAVAMGVFHQAGRWPDKWRLR